MNPLRKAMPILLAVAMVYAGWHYAGWKGVALAVTGMVTYVLVHLSRMMRVLRRAANHPKGHVASAVMLNAKLKPGANLVQVMALTSSIGEALSPEGEEPEFFRWTDDTASSVTCEFRDGRLVKWRLERPDSDPGPAAPTGS